VANGGTGLLIPAQGRPAKAGADRRDPHRSAGGPQTRRDASLAEPEVSGLAHRRHRPTADGPSAVIPGRWPHQTPGPGSRPAPRRRRGL